MIAVLTGDIINSRSVETQQWLQALKKVLGSMGKTPQDWEIYRGDSFQLETTPTLALLNSILIKASIKQNKNIDVRIGIGLGTKTNAAKNITESNGTAFVNAGACFDSLKKTTLAFRSDNKTFDADVNLLLDLAALTMNNWPPATAKIISMALQHPKRNQAELAKKLKLKAQSSISEALSRGGYDEINKLLSAYEQKISNTFL